MISGFQMLLQDGNSSSSTLGIFSGQSSPSLSIPRGPRPVRTEQGCRRARLLRERPLQGGDHWEPDKNAGLLHVIMNSLNYSVKALLPGSRPHGWVGAQGRGATPRSRTPGAPRPALGWPDPLQAPALPCWPPLQVGLPLRLGLVQTSEQESGAGQGEQKTQQEQELVHSAGAPPGLKHPRSVLWLQLGREKQQIQVSAPHDSAPWGPPSPSRKSMRGRGFPHSTARLPPGGGARPALQSYQLGGC